MTASVRGTYYLVQEGDTLSYIAEMFYGDKSMWHIIYDANIDVIGPDPNNIEIGMELYIP
ncbi:MAG: LysM peptidoglycan-binding domain-containing protein [Scytonematopsis contorta HA4267-MV1]|jgi:nucleoid-associated protein YgaU|nr:LysM peptidoglycan-binding domain-containing protein [Scytonematopsis contorta HA4267-MV1]